MANRLVSVDENLHLPPAVLEQLTADVRNEFNTSLTQSQAASTAASGSATAAAGSATAAANSATAAQNAAASILIPTDAIVDARIVAMGALTGKGGFVYDVTKYGAVGDGTTPCASAVQTAVNAALAAGGGVIYFPAGNYYMENYVTTGSNLTFLGAGPNATTLNKTGPEASYLSACFFWAQSGTNTGYGAGGRNITIEGIRFAGSYSQGRTGLIIQLHHTDGFTMRNCVADKIQGGGHVIDALGSTNILIEDCTFYGVSGARIYTECIQTDYSAARGFSMADANAGCDGLPTINVTVNRCKFLPITEASVFYYAPNPMGTHTGVQTSQPKNYKFTNNYVEDWQGDNTSTYNGALHFAVGVDGLDISNNVFTVTKPSTGYCINLYRGAFLSAADTVTNPTPPAASESSDPFPPRNVSIRNNTFRDSATSGDGISWISVAGDSRFDQTRLADRVVVADNNAVGGNRFGYFANVRHTRIANNSFEYGPTTVALNITSGTGIRIALGYHVTITGNVMNTRDPLWISNGRQVLSSGNTLLTVGVAAATTYGIYHTATNNGVIVGNVVVNETATAVTRGIYVSNTASNNTVTGNTIVGSFTNAGITSSGATNLVVPAGSNATATS